MTPAKLYVRARAKSIEVARAMADPVFVKWAKDTGYYLSPMGPEKFWKSLTVVSKIYCDLKPMITKATGK